MRRNDGGLDSRFHRNHGNRTSPFAGVTNTTLTLLAWKTVPKIQLNCPQDSATKTRELRKLEIGRLSAKYSGCLKRVYSGISGIEAGGIDHAHL